MKNWIVCLVLCALSIGFLSAVACADEPAGFQQWGTGPCASGTCVATQPAANVRPVGNGLVWGQPVRNVGRVVIAARPVRRVGGAILKSQPLRRVANAVATLRPLRRVARAVGTVVRARPLARLVGWRR